MRLILLLSFFGGLLLIGYFRKRPVSYKEQCAWTGGIFLGYCVAYAIGLMG